MRYDKLNFSIDSVLTSFGRELAVEPVWLGN